MLAYIKQSSSLSRYRKLLIGFMYWSNIIVIRNNDLIYLKPLKMKLKTENAT